MSIFNKVTKTFQWGAQDRRHGNRRNRPPGLRRRAGQHRRHRGAGHRGGSKSAKPGQDFFPLTVDYIEKTYAAGKIPGSFFKREAKPSELETLTSRLIDRPIRPLFPEGFFNEVQVVIHTVLSLNPEVDADIAAMIASSAALAISGIPFNGPIGAARVGYINGEYVLNPARPSAQDSQMDLVVAGTEAAVLMVESEASNCPKTSCWAPWCSATRAGQDRHQRHPRTGARRRQARLGLAAPAKDEALIAKVTELAEDKLRAAYQIRNKQARTHACREAYAVVMAA
jgi:polyribonucleotide nucleotidyltransferase